ncbi:MAG TPA: choice-of-anchor D domain-containing protein, partial [Nitrospirae bacterium]|nr:choice-of-anchor D domain-containing protein [Nitrospirota bacterium]
GGKPLIKGSAQKNSTGDWSNLGSNQWATANGSFVEDVGNIIFDNEASTGIKEWTQAEVDAEREFWYDSANQRVVLYSTLNPALVYTSIEIPKKDFGIDLGTHDYITISDMEFKYANVHGIRGGSGSGTLSNITISYVDISYVGGKAQDAVNRKRYGNGIEFWQNARDILVEYCNITQVLDAGLTNQSDVDAAYTQENITYRYNNVSYCNMGYEFFSRNAGTVVNNIYVLNNTFSNAGFGWSGGLPSTQSENVFSAIAGTLTNFYVRDNVFDGSQFDEVVRVSGGSYTFERNIIKNGRMDGVSIRLHPQGTINPVNLVKFHYNLIYDNAYEGIFLGGINDAVEFYNNVVIRNGDSTHANTYVGLDSTNTTWKNNILVGDMKIETSNVTLDYNCYYRDTGVVITYLGVDYTLSEFASYQTASGQDAGSIAEDPLFVDAPNNDFHLTANSSCIDRGVDVGLAGDFEENPIIPPPDIGAFEYRQQDPDISVTPSAIDFGNVTIGNSSDQIVTVGNNGLNDLIIGTVTSPSSPFSIAADNCSGQTLVFSATCTITYRFSPASAATFSSGSDIPSNDPYTPVVTMSLTGTGVTVTGPDISATPASRDFGIVAVSDVSPSQIFTVFSNGTTDLVIGGVYLTGTNPYQFNLQYENCSGQTIVPSGSCTIEARYEPTKTGTMYAKIGVDSNDPDTPTLYINLTGTGVNTTPPVADPNGPYTGVEGQAISLDASGSTDADGTITLYEWDIDNDGTFDYSSSSPIQSHTYASQDTYTINLRVTDDAGATDEATTTATISDTSPTADFTGSPTSGLAPLTVNFTDNSTGYDQPLSHEWDFENDGVIDSTVQNPSYTYNTAGTYTVSLTATDSDGSADSLTRTDYITVTACPDPVRIEGATPVYYSTLQAAYNAAIDGDIIQSQAVIFTEDLNINRSISVTFEGGYDCDYTAVSGNTTINGTMTISAGTVTIGNFVLD